MSCFFIVIEAYITQYKIPVTLYTGETVKVGERFTEDSEWPGWIWCENERGEKGWVLERVLKIDYDNAAVLEDFCSRELDVKTGETLEALTIEGGWIWCKNYKGESGWVPLKNVKQIEG